MTNKRTLKEYSFDTPAERKAFKEGVWACTGFVNRNFHKVEETDREDAPKPVIKPVVNPVPTPTPKPVVPEDNKETKDEEKQ
jgi:hypothetical protein